MLKPKSVDLYLVYGCPNCGAEHTATREETIFPGGVLCGCGEKIRFQPIDTIKVIPNYREKPVKTTVKVEKTENNHEDVVALLVGMGYNKSYARDKVEKLKNLSEKEILEVILREKP